MDRDGGVKSKELVLKFSSTYFHHSNKASKILPISSARSKFSNKNNGQQEKAIVRDLISKSSPIAIFRKKKMRDFNITFTNEINGKIEEKKRKSNKKNCLLRQHFQF
jgi:hypothetical protein